MFAYHSFAVGFSKTEPALQLRNFFDSAVKPLVVSVVLSILTLPLFAAEDVTPASSTFTEEQFERGEALYQSSCASCHGDELDNGAAPQLRSATFRKSWSRLNVTVGDLLQRISTTMPPGEVGSLDEQQNLEILAFLLAVKKNGVFKPHAPHENPLLLQGCNRVQP